VKKFALVLSPTEEAVKEMRVSGTRTSHGHEAARDESSNGKRGGKDMTRQAI